MDESPLLDRHFLEKLERLTIHWGKSFPGFGPIGPWLVTPDELPDRDDLRLSCAVDGRVLQEGRTKDMIFSGAPAEVGMGRRPPEFLRPGTTLLSTIEGAGQLRNALTAGPSFATRNGDG